MSSCSFRTTLLHRAMEACMFFRLLIAVVVCWLVASVVLFAQTASLRGSPSSVARMARQAKAHDFTHMRNGSHVMRFVNAGLLVRLGGNRNYRLDDEVSYPYVRPEVRTFVNRVTEQSRSNCSDLLVLTSGTRPTSSQPRNASPRSVHPTGMAVDFRYITEKRCRDWFEGVTLYLERIGVAEVTLEKSPIHYHVAVFPKPYARHVAQLTAKK